MTEFAAYFDDGGHPDDQIAVLVAGFISTEEQWLRFEKEWKRALEPFGIQEFHRTDFEASKKWSRDKKNKLRDDLLSIIKRRTQYHISHVVPMKEYRDINEQRAFEEMVGTPYALAGRTAARSINDWKRKYMKAEDKLVVLFEDGTKHKGDFMGAMKRDDLPCPRFIEKVPPLEAADFLAWEILHALKNGYEMTPILDYLLGRHPGDDGIYQGNDLLKLATKIPVPPPLRENLGPNSKLYHHSSPKNPRKRTIF
jgi:hypothetical protein